jgi:hypothetical protein
VLVRLTESGVEVSRLGLRALARVQREVEERVGAGVVQGTFEGLRAILAGLHAAGGAAGRPAAPAGDRETSSIGDVEKRGHAARAGSPRQ